MTDPKDRETVLYAFAVEPRHDQDTLNRYLAQYPELSGELIDLAFELRLVSAQSSAAVEAIPDSQSDSAWAQFIGSSPATSKPTKSGSLLSKFRGQAFVDLANRLQVPRSILTAFRDRLVEPLSVPERFLQRMADSIGSTLQELRDFLSNPPLIIGTAEFKANKKPLSQGRVTFRQLVENTEMTNEERKELLQGCDDDGRK